MDLKTVHRIIFGNAATELPAFRGDPVDLVVTSPPYPMISIWDRLFSSSDERIADALLDANGEKAFELMHQQLDEVWKKLYEVLNPGGIACINIGDATRSIGGRFRVFPNHARILNSCTAAGFDVLPEILWRKQSNKPNKFIGSGMLPAGAYPTQEHEYIVILRKGTKRVFSDSSVLKRRYQSAYFWEERNEWFSDVWENIKGTRQTSRPNGRRTASFPLDLCYRLICMFSIIGDTVMDPFAGTGTAILASIAAGRNSVGIEIDRSLGEEIESKLNDAVSLAADLNGSRIASHRRFISDRLARAQASKMEHINRHYGFPVVTSQETELRLPELVEARLDQDFTVHATYR